MRSAKSAWETMEKTNMVEVEINGVKTMMTIRKYKALVRKRKAERESTNKNVNG